MADARIQDLDPVNQVQDNDNFVLEQNKKAHRLTGSKLIRYLVTACDKLGILGVHVGPDEPKENQNVWIEEVENYEVPDESFALFDSRYPKKSEVPSKTSQLENDSGFITASEAPVQSVNGQMGAVTVEVPTKTSELTNNSGFITADDVPVPFDDNQISAEKGWTSSKIAQSVTPALTRTVSGEVIAVDDVSPLEHEVECKVSSVNILNGAMESGSFDSEGTPAVDLGAIRSVNFTPVIGGSTITFSNDKKYGNYVSEYDSEMKFIQEEKDRLSSGTKTVTLPQNCRFIKIRTIGGKNQNDLSAKFWANYGIEALPCTPYIPDLSKVTVTRQRADGTDSQTYKPSPEGIVSGMTSLSPNMTILTDTPGALLDVTYNADPMTIIGKLTQRVADLESAQAQI